MKVCESWLQDWASHLQIGVKLQAAAQALLHVAKALDRLLRALSLLLQTGQEDRGIWNRWLFVA